jgi:RHS repeat-associated protein
VQNTQRATPAGVSGRKRATTYPQINLGVIHRLRLPAYCNATIFRTRLGGRLTEDANHFYHYDCEGNLVFKEFKKPQGYSSLGKAALQKKYGIRFKATATGWLYEWSAGGMLERVVNPQQGKVTFGYDALGRRVYKEVKHTRTKWLWDGNVPLHEWQTTEKELLIDIVTWVFEEGTFVPAARITDKGSQSILTDYLGTPVEIYDANGEKTWEAQLDIYGRVRTFVGSSLSDCPFRYQGQYEDAETGLYYNRFRYYDPSIGAYLSQDPIGLAGGDKLYGYVYDVNSRIDVLGLFDLFRGMQNVGDSPKVGNSADKLGVRPGVDIGVINGQVTPGTGGMSVNRSTDNIPVFRKPESFGGTQKNSLMFKIDSEDLGANLTFKPDSSGTHGVIEPSRPMSLKEYQDSLGDLNNKFKKVCP